MTDRIERSIDIDAPLERVWDLVSVPGWWVTEADTTEGDRTPGSVTTAHTPGGPALPIGCVEQRPKSYAAFRWSPMPGEPLTPGRTTLVEFTLEQLPSGVRVSVVESGFASLDVSDEVREENLKENTSGWVEMLGLLREHAQA